MNTNRKWKALFTTALLVFLVFSMSAFQDDCGNAPQQKQQSATGVQQATAKVETNADGHTVEQMNIYNRLKQDNTPGSIKHLYIISAYSGQVLLYSTVTGKVTSSGKRLTPSTVSSTYQPQNGNSGGSWVNGFQTNVGITSEVLQDDGTFGSSAEYIYWFDSKGVYHQQYITGGMILHISSEPISVKSVVINLESRAADQ